MLVTGILSFTHHTESTQWFEGVSFTLNCFVAQNEICGNMKASTNILTVGNQDHQKNDIQTTIQWSMMVSNIFSVKIISLGIRSKTANKWHHFWTKQPGHLQLTCEHWTGITWITQWCSEWHYIQPAVKWFPGIQLKQWGVPIHRYLTVSVACTLSCSESLKMHSFKKNSNTYQTSSGVFLDIFTYLELELSYMCS